MIHTKSSPFPTAEQEAEQETLSIIVIYTSQSYVSALDAERSGAHIQNPIQHTQDIKEIVMITIYRIII